MFGRAGGGGEDDLRLRAAVQAWIDEEMKLIADDSRNIG